MIIIPTEENTVVKTIDLKRGLRNIHIIWYQLQSYKLYLEAGLVIGIVTQTKRKQSIKVMKWTESKGVGSTISPLR